MRFPKSESNPSAMIFLGLAVLCLAIPLPAAAEDPAAEARDRGRTVVKLTRFVDVRDLEPILEILDVQVRLKPDLNAVVLRGKDGGDLDTALKLIEALDEPTPTIGVSVYVVAASRQDEAKTDISPELEAAVKQLQTVFGYRGFKVLDTVYLQVREGRRGEVAGGVELAGGARSTYQFGFRNARVTPVEDGPVFIRLDGLQFELAALGASEARLLASFKTDVQVRIGQKAVIGKSTPEGTDETMILIVEAGIVESETHGPRLPADG